MEFLVLIDPLHAQVNLDALVIAIGSRGTFSESSKSQNEYLGEGGEPSKFQDQESKGRNGFLM